MHNSKIIELLQQLDSRTLTRFGEYVASPYFNKHKETTILCNYLLKEAPQFKRPNKLSKERVFKNIFPNHPFHNKNFHRLTSSLLQLLHNFLIDDAWQTKKNKRAVVLLEQLRKYKLEKHYRSTAKQYQKQIQSQLLNKSEYKESQYKFYKELDLLFVEQGGRAYNENLQLSNDFLDQFFILEKLKMACDMANRNKVIQADYQWSLMNDIKEHLQQNQAFFSPIIQIYYTIFQMLTSVNEDQTEEIYNELKGLLKSHADSFTKTDIMQTYSYALNYAIGQINKKGAIYLPETLELYLYLVESEAIFVAGQLMPQEYKNIVTLGVRLEKYDWTEEFIEQYQAKLPKDVRNNVYKYNLASLQHSKGAYDDALQTLHNVDFINPTYYLGTKIIQLKIFYELNESEALFSLVDACLSYLRRSATVADYQKKSTASLMKFTQKLCKIKDKIAFTDRKKTIVALEKLETEIQKSNSVANRDWLNTCLKKIQVQFGA